ncbi:hypothetical protein ASZ78_010029 [Callipepla squamata]|uniref:Major facilitator superfamily (MFS) profile domain-containing protein n=1 Tax=Callipepla squamata TaxID=9009 RepID=A0A226NM00_CALSU|nr:hypothetical protein ASZ78_010029 [Callipepla squamata]
MVPPCASTNVFGFFFHVEDGTPEVPGEESRRLTRQQLFTMLAAASINFSSMICFSILGPFFPAELCSFLQAEKKGASSTVVGLIFGCFAVVNFLTSLIFGNYLTKIGAKFMFVAGMFVSGCVTILFGMLDKVPNGPMFIGMCFLVRAMDAIGFAAAMTASFSILAKAFPSSIATVLVSTKNFTTECLSRDVTAFSQYFSFSSVSLKSDAIPSKESFWKLFLLPKVLLLCFTIFSLSACLGFLDPTMSLFILKKFKLPAGYVGLVFLGLALSYSLSSPLLGLLSDKMPHLRKWLLVSGSLLTALCFFLLGPAPVLHIESENGFEEGLSLLGLVSGLFNAMWSLGAFIGPTLGGFQNEKLGFEWASAIQGGWALLSGLVTGIFYIAEATKKRNTYRMLNLLFLSHSIPSANSSSSSLQNPPSDNEERTPLLGSET